MISDPKVGDVVYLDPNNYANWLTHLRLGERYQITRVADKYADVAYPVRLRSMRTGELMSKGHSPDGTWACYLMRDEFLTAAYRANKGKAA